MYYKQIKSLEFHVIINGTAKDFCPNEGLTDHTSSVQVLNPNDIQVKNEVQPTTSKLKLRANLTVQLYVYLQ